MNDSWHDMIYNSDMIELGIVPQMQPASALAQIAADRRRDKAEIAELRSDLAELRTKYQNLSFRFAQLVGASK